MIYNLRLIMQKRTIPVLDSFFDRLSLLLWPRFKQVFDANLKSVKLAQSKKFIVTELTPHYISRFLFILTSSILFSNFVHFSFHLYLSFLYIDVMLNLFLLSYYSNEDQLYQMIMKVILICF